MRKNKVIGGSILALSLIMTSLLLTGCGQAAGGGVQDQNSAAHTAEAAIEAKAPSQSRVEENPPEEESGNDAEEGRENMGTEEDAVATELLVSFGDDGDAFSMHLYDNETAQAVAGHVGTADWRLPIYNYDNYDGWEYFQYYDIPSRYDIPSNPESISAAKAGEVYYSEPNRIILFYHDAEISGEYTPIGYIDSSEAFVEAVEDNPVLEGWGNKIVLISDSQ